MWAVFQLSFLKSGVFVSSFSVNALSFSSPLAAALHVVDLILKFILCTVGTWEPLDYSFIVKPVRTPVAIFGSLGVCIYGPASRHGRISYSPINLT